MNDIDREVYAITFNDWYPKVEYHVFRLHEFWKRSGEAARQTQGVIPFSIISGLIFIGCSGIYATHSQTLTPHMAIAFFILSAAACAMSVLSLLTEKGGLHKLQAIVCLFGNVNLVALFFNFLNSPL